MPYFSLSPFGKGILGLVSILTQIGGTGEWREVLAISSQYPDKRGGEGRWVARTQMLYPALWQSGEGREGGGREGGGEREAWENHNINNYIVCVQPT